MSGPCLALSYSSFRSIGVFYGSRVIGEEFELVCRACTTLVIARYSLVWSCHWGFGSHCSLQNLFQLKPLFSTLEPVSSINIPLMMMMIKAGDQHLVEFLLSIPSIKNALEYHFHEKFINSKECNSATGHLMSMFADFLEVLQQLLHQVNHGNCGPDAGGCNNRTGECQVYGMLFLKAYLLLC